MSCHVLIDIKKSVQCLWLYCSTVDAINAWKATKLILFMHDLSFRYVPSIHYRVFRLLRQPTSSQVHVFSVLHYTTFYTWVLPFYSLVDLLSVKILSISNHRETLLFVLDIQKIISGGVRFNDSFLFELINSLQLVE